LNELKGRRGGAVVTQRLMPLSPIYSFNIKRDRGGMSIFSGYSIKVAFAPKIGELFSRLSSYLLTKVVFQLYGNAINYIFNFHWIQVI